MDSIVVGAAGLVLLLGCVLALARAARRFGWWLAPNEGLRDWAASVVYGSGLVRRTPGSLLAHICRLARREHLAVRSDRRIAPCGLQVGISPDEAELLDRLGPVAEEAIAAASVSAARAGEWKKLVDRRPTVAFVADERVSRGRPELTGIYDPSSLATAGRVVRRSRDGRTRRLTEETEHLRSGAVGGQETTNLLRPRTAAQVHAEVSVTGGGRYPLSATDPTCTVGRSATCELRAPVSGVSRVHARVMWRDGLWVEDLASTNGVFVNGSRIDRPRLLRPDDVVRLGRDGPRLTVAFRGTPRTTGGS